MEDPTLNQINKLLHTIEESNLLLRRAMLLCDQMESQLKVRLSERMEIV